MRRFSSTVAAGVLAWSAATGAAFAAEGAEGAEGDEATASSLEVSAGPSDSPMESVDPEARARYEAGLAWYASREYGDAAREFRAAHGREPRPEYLFSWAQAERLSGDCQSALVLYRRYLATAPTAEQEQATRENVLRCEAALASGPMTVEEEEAARTLALARARMTLLAPVMAPVLAPAKPAAPQVEASGAGGAPSWRADAWTLGLGTSGAIAMVLGVSMLALSHTDSVAADSASSEQTTVELLERSGSRRTLGVAGLTVGTAALGAAVARGLWVMRPSVTPVIDTAPGGATMGISGKF